MNCDTCLRAEMGAIRYMLWKAAGGQPNYIGPMSPMAGIAAAMVGGHVPTWYEQHREDFARSGDQVELTRMLRHVADR